MGSHFSKGNGFPAFSPFLPSWEDIIYKINQFLGSKAEGVYALGACWFIGLHSKSFSAEFGGRYFASILLLLVHLSSASSGRIPSLICSHDYDLIGCIVYAFILMDPNVSTCRWPFSHL